ncbi:adenylyl-sulfate kinase [Agaricicola taiwanensis]|uniref:Adenylyl-sulfate kinase n=1 Tax=Agaricicola taiwanensis TaxID=591372 RepID=A0A8J2VKV4_9RHOB|nr:adenylyl-sulfate kinase [Agaricicola taiwanensis]GGE30627.1 adenylyl-sulfate kinase [Agaricicola taiwanensis]
MNLNLVPAAAAPERDLVRIVIVGHVDHGKSTLIGRLLHETNALPDGKLEMLQDVSRRRGMPFEWSFLLDALQTERDQGITIDTSQIRFATEARDFILIDAPGHVEFLRNMVTGAAQADAAVLMVDAAEGVREQTRRHGFLLHLLGVRQVIAVVNKMDRVGYAEDVFRAIESELTAYLAGLGIAPSQVIPISAREGDFVASRSGSLGWFDGPTVIEALDLTRAARPSAELGLRFPVQAVYKFDERRILAGRIETGRLNVGDDIVFVPSGAQARVKSLEAWPANDTSTAGAGRSIGITLDRPIFVARGDVGCLPAARAKTARQLKARVFWLGAEPLIAGREVTVRLATASAPATVSSIDSVIDTEILATAAATRIERNQVGEITLDLPRPIAADAHTVNPVLGRFVIEIDRRIAGGGILMSVTESAAVRATNVTAVTSDVTAAERTARHGHSGAVIWLTGLPSSGKSTLARALERSVFNRGGSSVFLDGDTLRTGLNADLGFTETERSENIRRTAEVATLLARDGHIVVVALVSPAAADRARARTIAGHLFHEIHLRTSLEVCEGRDPKGLYRRARAGEIVNFTGVDASYEEPHDPELALDTGEEELPASTARLIGYLESRGILRGFGSDSI